MAESLYIRNTLSPGDYVVLSAAVRDLHKSYPGRFQTMVDVPQPAVFAHNPYVTHFARRAGMRTLTASYHRGKWSIHRSNQQPAHFMWGFIGDLNLELKTDIKLTDFRPDLHLTEEEKKTPLVPKPYWVFSSGGKKDYTTKWWDPAWWQVVADSMKGWMTMVQVGGGSHIHPPIKGIHNLVEKTSFRDLMRLIYHSEGVLCAITCFMHIAAAFNRPCVVVAGGREGWQWEAYDEKNRLNNMRLANPTWNPPVSDSFIPHRYLHTIGQLDCCKTGGCWASKAEPGSPKSCSKAVRQNNRWLPRCLQMITPETVLGAVEWYYQKGILSRSKTPSTLVQVSVDIPSAPSLAPNFLSNIEIFPERINVTEFKNLKKEWALWPGEGMAKEPVWLDELSKRIALKPNSAFGLVRWKPLSSSQAEIIKKATWYTGLPLDAHPLIPTASRAFYVERKWAFAAPSHVLKGIDLSGVSEEDLDVFLGEALRQRGLSFFDIGSLVEEA